MGKRFWARLALGCSLTILSTTAFAAPPSTALFEGMLTSGGGGAAADGEYELTFNIYGAPSGGSALWSEGPVKVKVSGGLFSYALGTSKPLDAVKLAAAPQQWVAVKVASDPELPRVQMHASVYALHAGKASGLMCSGCVSVSAMKFDGDVDLSGFSVKAKNGIFTGDLVAGSFAGDGSKLTGIKMPTGECKNAGEVVKGINADGSLKCVKGGAGALPIDGLNEISNDVLTNQFVETMGAPSKKVPIPDNQGVDAVSALDFPSIGVAQTFDVVVNIENTDLASVSAYLLPPDDKKTGWVLCDPCGKKDEKKYTATFNAKNPPKAQAGSGLKIDQWVGKNPKGLWTLKVKDVAFCIPQQAGNAVYCNTTAKTDGWIADWSVKMQYVSNNKVATNGSQEISKDLKVGGDLTVAGSLKLTKGFKIGADTTVCDAKHVGAMRYNASLDIMERCSSKGWMPMSVPVAFPDSKLISLQDGITLNSWVGAPFKKWKRCFSKSVDGASASTFHSKCNYKGPTITVIKNNKGKLFGGYAGCPWVPYYNSYSYQCGGSFLFSLDHQHKYEKRTASNNGSSSFSHNNWTYNRSNYGPCFGGGHDMCVNSSDLNGGYCNLGHDYTCRVVTSSSNGYGGYSTSSCQNDLCGAYSWNVVDMEVWMHADL